MGRQIRYYFDDQDEKEILGLPYFSNFVLLKYRDLKSPQPQIVKLEAYSKTTDMDSQLNLCCIEDLRNVEFVEYSNGWYYIDNYASPVIEFIRSGYKPELNLLLSGRLWYEHKYWTKDKEGNDILVEKSKKLEKLYNSLAGWIRRHCTRMPDGNYMAPHAMELYKKGAKLSGN